MREATTRFKTVICQNHSMFLSKALLQKSSDSFSYDANCLSRMQELPLGAVCTSREMPHTLLAMHVEVEHATCTSLVS